MKHGNILQIMELSQTNVSLTLQVVGKLLNAFQTNAQMNPSLIKNINVRLVQ